MTDGAPREPAGPPEATPPRHLHGAAAILSALDNVRDLLITVVFVVLIGSRSSDLGPAGALVLALAGAGFAIAVGYARWQAETYQVVDGSIRHRHGVISPDETVVPLRRVHSIDTSEGPIQRLFGVHELHVQTAGGGAKGEIVLRAVSEQAARELRAAAGLEEPVAPERPQWRLSGRGLVLTALTAPQLGVLLPVVGATVALFDNVVTLGPREDLPAEQDGGLGAAVALVAALGVGALALAVAGAVIAFAGFTVVRDGDRLRIGRGVLQRRVSSVPLRRIHALRITEGPLRRPLGLCAVRIETTGYGREPSAAQTLFPLVRTAALDGLLAELVPHLAGARGALERPPGRSRRRYATPRALAGAAAGAVATAIWPAAWPAIGVLAVVGALDGLNRHRVAGWRLSAGRIVLRGGSLAHRTIVARTDRLQDHDLSQSPFQRRARLASLALTVGSGTTASIPHLDLSTALPLFTRLRPAAGRPGIAGAERAG